MAIPTILKGDTAREITLVMAEGYDYDGCTLIAQLGVAIRTFTGLAPGDKVGVEYEANETATFPLGTSKLYLSLENSRGEVRTLPWAKVKVTDSPGEVYGAEITIDPGDLDVADLTAADSLGAVKTKLQAVIDFLRGVGKGAALSLVAALSLAAGAAVEPKYATINDLPGTAQILTNAAEYAEDQAATALADAKAYTDAVVADIDVDMSAVTNIAQDAAQAAQERAVASAKANTTAATNAALSAAFSAAVEYTDNQIGPIQESVTSLDGRVEAAEISLSSAWTDLWDNYQWRLGVEAALPGISNRIDTLSSDVDLYVEDHRVDIERVERRIDETTAALIGATNDLWQAIESIEPAPGPSEPCPVASRSWNRPGEWTIDYAPIMAPQSSEFIDLFTDAVGIVFSNVTRTASRGLAAQIYSESLDLLGEDAPPALASIIVSDGGSAAGDIVTVPTSGLYRVRGIAVTGAAREIAVSFAADAAKKTFESYYLSDTNANRAAVNDYAAAALAGMGAVRTDTDSAGNAYTIYSTCLPGFGAKNGTGQFAPYAIAPKFAASAAHYPWVDCQNQTYTVNGDTFTVTRGGPVFNLGTWAATNGFTEAELRAGGAYDVAIIPLAEGKQFPAAACPYFATPEWIARNYISLRQLTVWTVAQTSEYGIPTVLTGDGADGKLYYWLSAGGLQPGNPRPRFDLAALIGEYNERGWWRIQVGDSGKPVWFVDQSSGTARPILISHFEYVTGGPNYTALARVVAALCAAFDTPCKLLQ